MPSKEMTDAEARREPLQLPGDALRNFANADVAQRERAGDLPDFSDHRTGLDLAKN